MAMIVIPNDWKLHEMQAYIAAKASGIEALRLMCRGEIGALPAKLVGDIESELIININDVQPRFDKIIRIGRRWYGFNPNLQDITTGELVDIDTLIKEGFEANAHKIMSILYRPLRGWWFGKYRIEKYSGWTEKNAEPFKLMKWSQVLGVSAFFLNLGLTLTDSLVRSLAEDQELMQNENLPSDGDGITPSWPPQITTFG